MNRTAALAPVNKDSTTVVLQQASQQTWWTSLTPEQRRIISNVAIALGISLVTIAALYLGNKYFRAKVANVEQSQSFGRESSATWAKQIDNAFVNNGWPGTDTTSLRNVLRQIPSQEDFKQVQASYNKLTEGQNLIEKMTDELKTTEYDEMLAIINGKPAKARDAKNGATVYDPHGWAVRLNNAINYAWLGRFWGTDEDAINAVALEIPTRQAYIDTATEYFNEYGTALKEDLRADLSQEDFEKYYKMILAKPLK